MIRIGIGRHLLVIAFAAFALTGCVGAAENGDEDEESTSSSQTRADEEISAVSDKPSSTTPIAPAPAPGNELHGCVSCGPGPQPWSDRVINAKKTH